MSGTVAKVEGSTITVTEQDGTVTKAVVSSNTTYVKDSTLTVADIKVGDTVTAIGQAGSDGTIAAVQLTDGNVAQTAGAFVRQGATGRNAGGQGGQGGAATGGARTGGAGQFANASTVTGTVQKIDGQTLTVAEQNGQTVTVTIGTNTRLRKAASAALADVTAGAQVTIVGQTGSDGSITATIVTISAAG
jgi:hypothetical protein